MREEGPPPVQRSRRARPQAVPDTDDQHIEAADSVRLPALRRLHVVPSPAFRQADKTLRDYAFFSASRTCLAAGTAGNGFFGGTCGAGSAGSLICTVVPTPGELSISIVPPQLSMTK